ncbi:SepM family pheromone-processing serine protease [Planococcus sp. CAU13]|uniref:SepM family pheromone-processing serine protease n=1 Tax=Planococcus sp. CAU13 TaxID=1541197 RepID=UPI00052FE043|nr:SepM family pheromone-processing serine protease [Planococcus sp. CAU13]
MKNKRIVSYLLIIGVIYFVSFYQMDSYITRPGSAYELSPLVHVENGDTDDEGSFSLMTISMLSATPALYVYSLFQDGYEILQPEQVRSPHESEEEYNVRQLKMMSDSQINALKAAFETTGMPYEIETAGVFVLNVLEGGAADDFLKAGDRVLSIDGNKFESQQEFIDYLSGKQSGDSVELIIEREERELVETIALQPLPTDPERVGLGISFVEDKTITTDPKVTIESEQIGGPSAGLMFTLEIINQLLEEDITKGYTVAGTGTMESEGQVGRIGGIDQKVMAADSDGMEIFFAPHDGEADNIESNYGLAVQTAEEIGTDMEIVPVKTLQDALDYLEELQPK